MYLLLVHVFALSLCSVLHVCITCTVSSLASHPASLHLFPTEPRHKIFIFCAVCMKTTRLADYLLFVLKRYCQAFVVVVVVVVVVTVFRSFLLQP